MKRLFINSIAVVLAAVAAGGAGAARGDIAREETENVAEVENAPPHAPQEPAAVSYVRDVLPIFRQHCHGCHQPAMAVGDYVMTGFDALLQGGASGDPAVVPGDVQKSTLAMLIAPSGGQPDMPKDRPPLTAAEVALVKRWIAEGAVNDSPPGPRGLHGERLPSADNPPVYRRPPAVTALDFSPDGKLLAVSGYHEVLLHAADGGRLVGRLIGLSERIESATFSPDGRRLAVTGGQPGRLGEVQIWDVASKRLALSLPVTHDTVYGGSWSPDGRFVALGGSDSAVRAIDAATGEQVFFNAAHEDWALGTVFSVESDHLVSVSRDRSMKLFEVSTQRFIDNVTSITPGALRGGLVAVDRHPARDELLTAGADGEPKIYQMHRTKDRMIGDDHNLIRKFPRLPGRLFAARYSPDGRRIAVGSSHDGAGLVHVFDADAGTLIAEMQGERSAVYTVAFSPDGRVVASGGFDGMVRLNEASTGKLIREFVPVPMENIEKESFHP